MHIYIYSVINISLGSNVHFEYRLAYYHICMVFYARVTVTKSNCTRASRLCNYFRTVTCAKNKPCKYCKYLVYSCWVKKLTDSSRENGRFPRERTVSFVLVLDVRAR